MSGTDRAGPLAHIKVVEVGSFIAGPFCGQLLADLGADLIKIEPPCGGDTMRQWGAAKSADGQSLWWPVIARNKRSVTLDLRTPSGQDIARRLIRQSDVLVENFRPGTLEGWGLGPDLLRADTPGLVIARVSGFGQTGPYSTRAGFGSVAEAMAGLRHLGGYPDQTPPRMGVSIGDSLAGMFAAIGIVASLLARPRQEGRGQVVDVAISESVLAVLESVIAEYSATGAVRGRTGPVLPGIAPSNLYPTADGHFVLIGANADGLFRRLAGAMGQPDLAADPRYATHVARGERQAELDARIADWTRERRRADVLAMMEAAGVPAGPVNDAEAVAADPHLRARGALVEVDTNEAGPLLMQGIVPHLSDTPGRIAWAGPRLGEHTDDVLRSRLGLNEAEIDALRAKGVI